MKILTIKTMPIVLGLCSTVLAFNNANAADLCDDHNDYSISSASSDDAYSSRRAPSRAIDGNTSNWSRWSSKGRGNSLELDLGQNREISQVELAMYQASSRDYYFDVETSDKGSTWKTVASDVTTTGKNGLVAYDLITSTARYVRIVGEGNSNNVWNHIIEANVIGCPESSADDNDSNNDASIALIKNYFDLEGGDDDLSPYQSDNTLEFDALKSAHQTPNGNGWRHELKMAQENRRDMDDTQEEFSARITPVLSDGSKTIVFQYHGGGSPSTLLKVYVSDTNEGDHGDSDAYNGVFDVYARYRKDSDDGDESMINFGTMRSGQSFDLVMTNNRGKVYLSVMGVDFEETLLDSDDAYLKFGNYLQAQDAESGDNVDDTDDFEDFYDDAGITQSEVTFSNVYYDRY